MAIDHNNQQAYESRSIVGFYANESDLQPAEEVVLNRLLLEIPTFRMLDIGVGGGRTTLHFGPWAAEYVGVDYAAAMIEVCKSRLKLFPRPYRFLVLDARTMPELTDDSFDFVFFSFNGIDHVTDADRWRIVDEMRRICRPGGYVAFSSHNLNRLRLFRFPLRLASPVKMAKQLYGWFRFNFVQNKRADLRQDTSTTHLMINNGIHDNKLRIYYGDPVWTVERLKDRFSSVEVLDLTHGALLATEHDLRACTDPWVHYLCRV